MKPTITTEESMKDWNVGVKTMAAACGLPPDDLTRS